MITAGIDLGSVATKTVVLSDGQVVGRGVARSGVDPQGAAEGAFTEALATARIERSQIERLVTTGCGRRAFEARDAFVTEISANARGAYHLGCPWGKPRLILDLGGQDTKVVRLDARGHVADFQMNDKCAAGTGRFLEVMAGILDLPLAQFAAVSERASDPVPIAATCAVFAESEVVSLIARGVKKEDLVAGLHATIASRLAAMVQQPGEDDVFFCGGGARDAGLRTSLAATLGRQIYVPPEPQFVVALGAALIAAGK